MDDRDERIRHVFVLTLWVEGLAVGGGGAVWRGHIAHPLSGEEAGVVGLRDVAAFVARFMETPDDRPGLPSPARRWPGRRRSRPEGWR
jgi:hypothetical protein